MKKIILLLACPVVFSACTLFKDDKVVIDVPPTTNIIVPADVKISMDSDQNESTILNFGALPPNTTVKKTIEISNTTELAQTFNVIPPNSAGPFRILTSSCAGELSPNAKCSLEIEAQSPLNFSLVMPLEIQKGSILKTVYLVVSPLQINCPANYSLVNSLCIENATPLTFAYASTTLVMSMGSQVSLSPVLYGGQSPYQATIQPNLPTGLTLSDQGVLSGTPVSASASRNYTVTVSDDNGEEKTAILTLSVVNSCPIGYTSQNGLCIQNDLPLNLSYSQSSKEYLMGVPGNLTPAFSGGASPVTFSISPALPVGLTINATTGVVSGSAQALSISKDYVVTLTDHVNRTTTATVTLSVINPCPTNFFLQNGSCVQNELQLAINYPESSVNLLTSAPYSISPNLSGGLPPYQLTITPALPQGLSFSSLSGKISGSITEVITSAVYTIKLKDSQNQEVQTTLTMSSQALIPLAINYTLPQLYVGSSYSLSPVVSGGLALNYILSCASGLPSGMSWDSLSGKVFGTPQTAETKTCTVSIQDVLGRTAVGNLNLSVQNIPLVLSYSSSVITTTIGSAISSTPSLVGGIVNGGYGISPPPTRGLIFDGYTGILSGTVTGLGPFNQVYTITAYVGGRNTSATVTVNAAYIPETVAGTMDVSLANNNFVRIVNDESSATAIVSPSTVAVRVQLPLANQVEQDLKIQRLPDPAPITHEVDLSTPSNVVSSWIDNLLNTTVSFLKVNSFTNSDINISIKNLGQEEISLCQASNLSTGNPYNCSTGYYTVAGQFQANQNLGFTFRYMQDGIDPTLPTINLKITKQYGGTKTFTFNDENSPAINARKITNSLGMYSASVMSYPRNTLGEGPLRQPYIASGEYGGNLYLLLSKKLSNGITANGIYKYDGTSLTEEIKLTEENDSYVGAITSMEMKNGRIFFTSVIGGYFNLQMYDIQSKILYKINNSYYADQNYALLNDGVIYNSASVSNNSSNVYFYDIASNKSYLLQELGNASMDNVLPTDDESGFLFSTNQGAYWAKKISTGYAIQKLAVHLGDSAFNDCKALTKLDNLINLICPVNSQNYKFFVYDIDTNTTSQVSNLNSINNSDLVDSGSYLVNSMQILKNHTILFYSQNSSSVKKLYKIRGNTLTRISNFSGSPNLTDSFDSQPKVIGNKAYFSIYLSTQNSTCVIEYDDEKTVDQYRTIACNMPYSNGSMGSDSQGNYLWKNKLFKFGNENKIYDFTNVNISTTTWFENGKFLFADNNKYMYFDGQNIYQVSDTRQDARVSDLNYNPFAIFYRNKILYLGIDKNSGLPQLWEATLPTEIHPPVEAL